MQNALRNIGATAAMPRQQGIVPRIFQAYRNHFGLFWRVMLPIIIVSLVLSLAWFLFFKFMVPEGQWIFSISKGIGVRSMFIFDHISQTFRYAPEPLGVQTGFGFNGQSFDIGLLWLAMCPLALIIVYHHQGINVTSGEAWHRTRQRVVSILGVSILLILTASVAGITFVLLWMTNALQLLIQDASVGISTSVFLILGVVCVATVYVLVKWSLCNQCIILENLSAVDALRRSGELVQGRWGRFFGIYLLLILGTMIFTTAVLGLTLLLFSTVSPEFTPLREVLQSGKFFGLFFGGRVQITLQSAPVWAIGVMVALNTLINAVLAPIWAILTTHLYMERAGIPEQEGSG